MPRAVITGTSRGLGRALTEDFAAAGWEVVAVSRGSGSDVPTPDAVRTVTADISVSEGANLVRQAVGDAPLDLLINNAAVGAPIVPLAEATAAELHEALDLNVVAPFV